MTDDSVYAPARTVSDPADCYFYHTMDIPGHGTFEGQFDLRGREHRYLGGVELKGKRVLEIGTASGHLCFWMERQGAEVVAYDLSERFSGDLVPYHRLDYAREVRDLQAGVRRVNNSWWLAHRAFQSQARVVYGTVYEIPDAIGTVDVVTLCAVLLHFQNPFLAVQKAARLSRDKIVVTECLGRRSWPMLLFGRLFRPCTTFVPDFRRWRGWDTTVPLTGQNMEDCMRWWVLTPDTVRAFLGVVGFEHTEIRYHTQKFRGRRMLCFTIVGTRTRSS